MTTNVDIPNVRQPTTATDAPALVGIVGQFKDVDTVVAAARTIRDKGFVRWDVHSPFPIHGIDQAMDIRPTVLPWLVLGGGLTGLVSAVALQWYANVFDYTFFVSGKPPFKLPAFVPIIFELTILLAALTAFFGMLTLNKLPKLYNPLLKSAQFRRVTDDRFFIVIDASDPQFDEHVTGELLLSLGAMDIEKVED